MSRVAFVVAVARNGIIGRDGGLPWRIPADLKRFKQITMGKPVIMGRKTWEGLPRRPLGGRSNIVVTRQTGYDAPGARVAADVDMALKIAEAERAQEIAVIGGGEIFRALLPRVDRLYLTEVDLEVEGDTFFPALDPAEWRETAREAHEREAGETASFTLRILDRAGR